RVFEEGETKVYRVGDPLPRAWVVYDTETASDEEAIGILNSEGFHPLHEAVVAPETAPDSLPQGAGPGSPAQVLESSPGRLVLGIEPGEDGLLVVSQPFYPGWSATVDGEPAPIHRVDYLLQGVQVQAGSRRVELSYRLSPVPAFISLIFLVACVALIVVERRRA
ncbi:MAG: YfhO family protein, partial [Anaerolineae bacterium]|nr:YfhO family protein [Anaerolineae bacterium]